MASVETIVKDVEICLDEIALNDAEFDDAVDATSQDNAERETIIRSKIADALRFVYSNADQSLLEPDEVISSDIIGTNRIRVDKGVGKVTLPDNYLRLCYAHFLSWSRYCGADDIIMWSDKAYSMLSDKYCTGTPDRPKVAIGWNASGKKQLEMYSARDERDTARVGWMLEPKEEEDSEGGKAYNIPNKVYRACIYYIAGLVLTTYRNANGASMMFKEANDLMGFTASVPRTVAEEE